MSSNIVTQLLFDECKHNVLLLSFKIVVFAYLWLLAKIMQVHKMRSQHHTLIQQFVFTYVIQHVICNTYFAFEVFGFVQMSYTIEH